MNVSRYPIVALGKIVTQERDTVGTPNGDGLPVYGVTNVAGITVTGNKASEDKSQYLLLRPHRLAYNPYRINVGSLGLSGAEQSGIVSPAYVVFRTQDDVEPEYVYRYLKSAQGITQINYYGNRGSVRAALRFDDLCHIQIPLPPLAEQRRIVARIEALEARIAEARGLRQAATAEAEALLDVTRASLFETALKAGSRPLYEVATLERGRFSYRPRNEPRFFGGAHPWIQIAEIEASGKYIRQWSQTLNDEGLAVSRKFPRGTLLISIAATIGAVGILDFDCCIPDSIVGVTPRAGNHSVFLYHYLEYLRGHLEQLAPQSAQKNINLGILAPLPVPTLELDAQRQISGYLDDVQCRVDELKRVQQESAEVLNGLLPSLLDKAFRGEL